MAAHDRFLATFAGIHAAAGTTPAQEAAALRTLANAEPTVPLARCPASSQAEQRTVVKAESDAMAASTQALSIGTVAAILAVLAGAGFGLFALQLLDRSQSPGG